MKVILLTDVKKQGKKDQVITVSDGYANNFLINKGLAVPYNEANKKRLEHSIKTREEEEQAHISECEKIRKEMEKKTIHFKVKTGKDGKMFGTISNKQIADELKGFGFDIDKKIIACDHTIDTLGTHVVKVQLHKSVIAEIKVITE